MQNFPETAPPAPKPISYLPVYSMKRIARPCFACIIPICIIIFSITDQWRHFFSYLYEKTLILKRSLILATLVFDQNLIQKIRICVLMELKCFFSKPSRLRFLAILVSGTKMSILTLCFSILFLQISCWVKKNVARVRGGDILTSCINAQPVMINSLGK